MGLAIITGSAGLIGSEAVTFFSGASLAPQRWQPTFLCRSTDRTTAGTQLHGFLSYLMKCTMTGKHYSVFGYGIETTCHGRYVLHGLRAA